MAAACLLTGCFHDDFGTDPADDLPETFAEANVHPNFDWDMYRTVTVALRVDESARQDDATLLTEIRHTTDGGSLLFRGALTQKAWVREVHARIPEHESSLTVTTRGVDGRIRRERVTLDETGRAEVIVR